MVSYLVKLKFKGRLQYGRALLYDILSGIIIYILDIIPLVIVLSNFKINNWTAYEMLFLFSFARAGRVFGDLMFWMPMFRFDGVLKDGRLDRYLLAPTDSFWYYIGNQFTTFTLGHCFGSVLVAILCVILVDVKYELINVICFFIAFIGGSLSYAGIVIALGSIAFWTLDLSGISNILMDITKFTNYPIEMFPRFIRGIITFILPLALTAYFPATILLGKQHNAVAIALVIGITGTAIFFAAYKLWWFGVKRYQGTGS